MPAFSKTSLERLSTCHPDLQTLFNEVIKYFDCAVIVGHRGQAEQDAAFRDGLSKLKWPNGQHNSMPSMAADVAPYPIDWKDTKRFCYFAGVVMGIAETLLEQGKISHKIRWGGDWNMNSQVKDETFHDLPHFELRKI